MPRISAPTVVEHRALQREALVAAASDELLENGLAAVTPASVGKRAGLARSSVYEYFPSASDLVAEVALRSFQQWGEELSAAMAAAPSGIERLAAYITTTLRLVAEGKYDIVHALHGAVFSPEKIERFEEQHTELVQPLRDVIAELGLSHPEVRVELIQGVVDAGVKQVAAGRDVEKVSRLSVELVTQGLLN
jgi:AcrR family transcriptional regulator